MDVIITDEGRRQLASGDLRIKFATFSDASSRYVFSEASGSLDIGDQIYLEAGRLPQDSIVPEADDSGKLMPFGVNGDVLLHAGQLFQDVLVSTSASTINGSSRYLEPISGSAFSSLIEGILTGSIDNFSKLRTLSTWDPDFEEEGFSVSPKALEFPIKAAAPISGLYARQRTLTSMDSIFNDVRFSQVPNFRYLPPINKIVDKSIDRSVEANVKSKRIANYPAWGTVIDKNTAISSLLDELKSYEQSGYSRRVIINPTSKENNLMCQFYEIGSKTAKKLDVIHFGKFNTQAKKSSVIDIFFVGKIFLDDNETQTFVHLFTLVFD